MRNSRTQPLWLAYAILVAIAGTASADSAPEVTNVSAQQRPNSTLVDIYYDVYDADGDLMTVIASCSDGAGHWVAVTSTQQGSDIGPDIASGEGKHIVWDAGIDMDESGEAGDDYVVRVRACDSESEELLYVGDMNGGLSVIDVSDPAAPVNIGSCSLPGQTTRMDYASGFVYVAAGYAGFQVVNVEDPGAPYSISECATPGDAEGIVVAGDFAYVGSEGAGMRIMDISNPYAAFERSHCSLPGGDAEGLDYADGYVYVADGWEGLKIIDVSDLDSPEVIGTYASGDDDFRDVAVQGDLAYVASYDTKNFIIVDVSNPSSPTRLGSCNTGDPAGHASDVEVSGGLAYLADYTYGLVVVDVSDPESPSVLSRLPLSEEDEYENRVVLCGNRAYVTERNVGVHLIDVSNPYMPELIGFWAADAPGGIAVPCGQ